jgi:hypothetical protein
MATGDKERDSTLYKVEVIGPSGVVDSFEIMDLHWDERDVYGITKDGKDIHVTGLGGMFCAIFKEISTESM